MIYRIVRIRWADSKAMSLELNTAIVTFEDEADIEEVFVGKMRADRDEVLFLLASRDAN